MKGSNSMLSKYMRLFAGGLAVFLIIEVGGLIYIDKSYLQEQTGDLKVQKITTGVSSTASNANVKIDSSAAAVKASYDGGYLAVTLNGGLVVINLTDGTKTKISMDKNMKLGFYKWVYDRDQLIIAETSSSTSHYYTKLYNLNAKEISTSSAPSEIRDTVNNKEAKITMPSKSSYVSDIDFSTSTVTTYLKITNKYGTSILWKFNVPDENKAYTAISAKEIGSMQCLKNESELLYENEQTGRVCVAGKGAINVDNSTKFKLLGFDSSDNIYLAKGDGKTTKEILYGSLVDESDSGDMKINLKPDLKPVALSKNVDVSKIYITLNGGIYENDTDKSVFRNLVTNKELAYRGKVKTVYGKGFITVDNGVVLQNSLD